MFLQTALPVTAGIAPWYLEFFKTQGALAALFLVLTVFVWKWVLPRWDARQERVNAQLDEADKRLVEQIKEGRDQVLRSEERNDKITSDFVSSLRDLTDALNTANSRNLDEFRRVAAAVEKLASK